jgi:hypothetical protein
MAPPQSMQQGYHFPPPDPDPAYGYGGQDLMPAQQQWGQPQPDPRGYPQQPAGYELAFQNYAPAEPGPAPYQSAAPPQQAGYGESEPEYVEDFYEDEEPRRGRRWVLIAVALVGAIGVGGALAYGYRSFVAPQGGRVPVVKADPNVKAKPDFRGGKEFAGAERRPPVRIADDQPQQKDAAAEPAASEPPAAENVGPRVVKPIPIAPGGGAPAAAPEAASAAVPGITLYQPPRARGSQQAAAAAPPPPVQPPPAARAEPPPQPAAAPPSRVVIGNRPEPEEEAAAAPPPVRRAAPGVQTGAVTPRPPAPKPASSGLGYVAVLFTEKSSMDASMKFADLQQKYTVVLNDKTAEVQETDLSERGLGTQYRLVVGPPGPKTIASAVCAQLKSAGYSGCWVKEY